jgi:hypothetical protein
MKMPLALRQQFEEVLRSGKTRRNNASLWVGTAFAVSLALAVAVLTAKGISTKSLVLALQLTARWSFLLFWLAYAGGATAALFGRAVAPIAGRGREFGLAFAAALLVHLGLVAGLFILTLRPPLHGRVLALFLAAAFLTSLLTVFSFGGLAKALGSRGWHALRFVALNFILCAFAFDFLPGALHAHGHYGLFRLIAYAPFAAMTLAAPLLVLAATVLHRMDRRQRNVRLEPVVN